MKKFGIITFHNANNYGAALQAYALQKYLKSLYGDDQVEVVDYKCAGVKKQNARKSYISDEGAVKGIIHYLSAHSRINKINRFCHENMSLSEPIADRNDLAGIADRYEFIVSGSDQIWNKQWTGGENTYLQDFHDNGRKKVSYAASFGVPQLPNEWRSDYQKLLNSFSRISVREEKGKDIIDGLVEKQCEVHLDPTLLLKKSEWDKIRKKENTKKKFVLVYMVPYQKSVYDKAKKIAVENGLELKIVCKSLKHLFTGYKGNAAVDEVISMFHDAEYVVTNSFHGTAFSVIYQKKFIVVLNNKWGYNIRSAQLIKKCGISDLTNDPDVVECFHVEWNKVNTAIDLERERTKNFFLSIRKPNI